MVSGGVTEGSKLCSLLASEISPSWKLRKRHLHLPSLETVLMGCYVCKEFECLGGIQWLLNREGIILSIPQKGLFSLAYLFSESSRGYIPTSKRQPSIDYPEAGTKYCIWMWEGPDRCHCPCKVPQCVHLGAPFSKSSVRQIHFLLWLPEGRLSYMSFNFWFYIPKGQETIKCGRMAGFMCDSDLLSEMYTVC